MSLTRDQILAADDVKIVKVSVPEWGGDVFVKSLLASQREAILSTMVDTSDGKKSVSFTRLLTLCLVDENGVSLGFTDEDVASLEAKSLSAIVKVGTEALKINGMTKEAVEDATKN